MAIRSSWIAAFASLTMSSLALAQDVGKPGVPATTAPAATGATPATGDSAGGTTTPAPTATAPAGPAAPMGYAYGTSTHKDTSSVAAPRARSRVHRSAGPTATLPGFEMLPEGGSRLFVQLTANLHVDEKPVAGGITYILKGAHVTKRNNENALVTVHFNTPVTRARLLPAGGDLHFVVDLRQNVKPTWKLVPAKDGATVLQIDFPSGEFLPQDAPNVATDDATSAKAPAPAKSETPKK